MREILFRAKNKNGKWVYGFYSQFHNRPVENEPNSHQIFEILEDEEAIIFAGTAIGGIWHIINEQTLGQYIGLKDKNGTKIFEGDIVMFNKGRNLPNYKCTPQLIKWHQGDCAFQRYPYGMAITTGGSGKLLQPDMMVECEVIGNVFDNGDLINEN